MAYKRLEITRPTGVNIDLSPYELPNEVWSEAVNVNFRNHRTNREVGYAQVFPDLDIQPLFVIPWTDYNTPYWYYADEESIYRTEGTAQLDVTRESAPDVKDPYNASLSNGWTGSIFNGALIMNNGTDAPQYFDVSSSNMQDLTAWPADYKCASIRPFKNYLVALDITNNLGERYPTMVKWSASADAGEVPQSWDETDPTKQAGDTVLPDTEGRCIDGLALNDSFIIYKNDSIWAMQNIGGNFVFSFRKIFSDIGILGKDCAAEFDGKHFVVGVGDVFVHDGSSKQSVITNVVKRKLYTQINSDWISRVKCVADHGNKEVWVYYPTQDSSTGLADRALVWNWEINVWAEKEISEVSHITEGVIDPQESNAWDDDPAAWNTDTTAWGEESYNPSEESIIMADYTNYKLYQANTTTTQGGAAYTSYVERIGLDFGDDLNYKYINGITPHFSGEGEVQIQVGQEQHQGQGVSWSSPRTFVVGTDYKADFRVAGRYIAVRFQGDESSVWALTGYTIEYDQEGIR
jgi:hypothetical protein